MVNNNNKSATNEQTYNILVVPHYTLFLFNVFYHHVWENDNLFLLYMYFFHFLWHTRTILNMFKSNTWCCNNKNQMKALIFEWMTELYSIEYEWIARWEWVDDEQSFLVKWHSAEHIHWTVSLENLPSPSYASQQPITPQQLVGGGSLTDIYHYNFQVIIIYYYNNISVKQYYYSNVYLFFLFSIHFLDGGERLHSDIQLSALEHYSIFTQFLKNSIWLCLIERGGGRGGWRWVDTQQTTNSECYATKYVLNKGLCYPMTFLPLTVMSLTMGSQRPTSGMNGTDFQLFSPGHSTISPLFCSIQETSFPSRNSSRIYRVTLTSSKYETERNIIHHTIYQNNNILIYEVTGVKVVQN